MRIQDVIASNVRKAREEVGLTQKDLGGEIGRWLRKPWPRQTASLLESGRRAFTAEELLAVALVLEKPIAYFFRAGSLVEVEMPSGATVSAEKIVSLFKGDVEAAAGALSEETDALGAALRKAFDVLQKQRDALEEVQHHYELLETVLLVASGSIRVEGDLQ